MNQIPNTEENELSAFKIQLAFLIISIIFCVVLISLTYFAVSELNRKVKEENQKLTQTIPAIPESQNTELKNEPNFAITKNLNISNDLTSRPHDINSLEFSQLSIQEQAYLKSLALYQYTFSSAFIFLLLIFAYSIHITFLLQNFIETLNNHKKLAGNREIGAHSWYLLIVIIGFPLALAVIPEFSNTSYSYKPELLSKIVLSTLSNLIVIMITAELSTIYFSLDQDTRIKDREDLMKKIFKDLRLKQLLVAIILDIITFYFISRLPTLKQNLNFQNILIILLISLAAASLISSFGAMFTLLTNEKMQKFELQKFD